MRTKPVVPDDIPEARRLRAQIRNEHAELQRRAPFIQRLTSALIDRQGKNHYIETLYGHGYRRNT